jgi:hypothetical protein
MTSKLFDKVFDKGVDILKDKLKDKVGDKALEWAKNIPIVGELCDAAAGDTPEKKRTRMATQLQQSAGAGQSEAMAAIARQQRILDACKDSINKMQGKINQQNGDLNKVWSDVNRTASKLESVGESLDGVKSSFLQLSADTKAGLQDFNWELRQLSETQESVKTQVCLVDILSWGTANLISIMLARPSCQEYEVSGQACSHRASRMGSAEQNSQVLLRVPTSCFSGN